MTLVTHCPNFVTLLDYTSCRIIKIKLSDEAKQKFRHYNHFETFLMSLESQYNFRLSDCCFMTSDEEPEVESYVEV